MKPFNRRIRIPEAYRTDPAVKSLVENFESSPKHPQARIFKSDHASTVAALPVNGKWFAVKIYHKGKRFKASFRFFRKSRGRKTWAAVHYLKAVDIPTVEPVALIEERLFFFVLQTCFISTFITGVNAHTYMRNNDIDIKDKRLAAVKIIEGLEKMHSLGIAHRDTKDDNIIIQSSRIYWLDLDSLSRCRFRPILAKKQRRDWWLLLYNFRDLPQIQQIFLDEMINRFGQAFAYRITSEMIRKRRRKIGISWAQGMIPFTDTSGKKQHLRIYAANNASLSFWQDIAVKFWTGDLPGIETVPSSTKARVFTGYIKNHADRLFFKQFYPRNKRDYLKQRFRKSRAYRDLKGTHLAAARGLKVPQPCCVIEAPKRKIGALSAIITAEVRDAIQLHHLLERLRQNRDFRAKRQLMRALGREMGRWHLSGMRHGDARDSNILCQIENPDQELNEGNISFWWLDNERSRPVIIKRELLRNLVQLNMTRSGVTLTDRMRFWQAYWADAGKIYHFRSEKAVLKKVAAKTKKRWIDFGWLTD